MLAMLCLPSMNTPTRTQELINRLRAEADPKFKEDMGKLADSLDNLVKGAAEGGRARAKKLTKKRRSEIARNGALVRWGKKP